MRRFTVTVLDTIGIQSYIFNSNRLRENIGASYLVDQATDEWVKEMLAQLGVPKSRQEEPIETSGLLAELIYAGGGNTVLLFKSPKIARDFVKMLSKKILQDAPGINLIVAHDDNFDWDNTSQPLYEVVKNLMKYELDRKKHERTPSAPLLGLGVTATCNSTQLPAIDRSNDYVNYEDEAEEDSYLISRETKQKLQAVSGANEKLKQLLREVFDQEIYQFPYRTDYLGRSSGSSSYAAVVHADGNSMGKRFREYGEGKSNRDYINDMRKLSWSVTQAGKNAIKAVAKVINDSIKDGKVIGELGNFALTDNNQGKYYLPFRPLVYGGDDVTFVCDGRLGLELAAIYLQEFEKQPVADGKPLRACAGVCIVKTHYPFARAYQISEALCKEAKKFVKKNKQSDPEGFSALDWHLTASGLLGSISEIRHREYQVSFGNLAMRPVRLHHHDSDWCTWVGFTKIVRGFNEDSNWKESRNKVIALRDVLRGGTEATEEFLRNYRLGDLPSFPKSSGQSEQLMRYGWLNEVCGYFDAIEAMEFYISLKEEAGDYVSTEHQTAK